MPNPQKIPEKILVIKLSALGDFILALPSMAAIRQKHPQAHITLLTTKPFADLAARSCYFDKIEIDTRPPFYELTAWFRLARFFNKGGFERVYDLQMNDRTKVYHRLFLKRPAWSGVIPGSALFYPNPQWRQMHALDRHKEVLKLADIDVTFPDTSWLDCDVSYFRIPEPFVLLVPGSAPQHLAKRWPAMKYAALAQRLTRDGYAVAVIGTNAEREVTERIKKICPSAHDLTGQTTLFEIAALAKKAAGAVGNDTGPMHIIAFTGCPVLSLFSSASDPKESAPKGGVVTVLATDDLAQLSVDDVIKNINIRKIDGAKRA